MSHDNWQTPPDLFRALDREFHFDLDAAASIENTLCPRFIGEVEDALRTPWAGENVFCNPPYSMLPAFVERASDQSEEQGNRVVLLVPAYTDTNYWWSCCLAAKEIRFLKGRLRFWEEGRPGKDTARFPSAVVIFDASNGLFQCSPNINWWDWRRV